jgi:hypothetical protein
MWVGICCKRILCAPDAKQINPDTGTKLTDKFNREIIIISREQLEKLGNYIYHTDKINRNLGIYPNFENNYNGAWYTVNHNDFLQSIYNQGRQSEKFNGNGMYTLTVKQFNAIEKIIK